MIQTWVVAYRYSQLEKLNLSVSSVKLTCNSYRNVYEVCPPFLQKSFSKTRIQWFSNEKLICKVSST